MKYAIGTPGEMVRVYVDAADPSFIVAQLQKGEVSAQVDVPIMNATINADGTITPPAAAS